MTPEEETKEQKEQEQQEESTAEATTAEASTGEPATTEAESAATEEAPADTIISGEVLADKVPVDTAVAEYDSRLRDYEMIIIISPETSEEQTEGVVENITRYVTGNEGAVIDIAKWGMKNLAYPIKHFTEGNYILLRLKMKPDSTSELENNLRIWKEVLRHLLIKLDS